MNTAGVLKGKDSPFSSKTRSPSYLDITLEQFNQALNIKKKPREKCPTPSMFNHPGTNRWVVVPCNQWKCPVCCKRKAWKLKKRIDRAIKQLTVRHLTLTIPDNTYDITGSFNNLRTQLRKRGKCKVYFWTKEFQERGVRHLHVLLFEYIHYTEIKTYWEGNIKIKLVKGNASYLTKYLTKVEEQRLFDKGERRYSSSRGFLEAIPEPDKESGWEYWGNRDLLQMFGVDSFNDVVKMIQNYGSSIEVW